MKYNHLTNRIFAYFLSAIVFIMLIACERREVDYNGNNGYSETIGFRVVDRQEQTRKSLAKVNTEEVVYKTMLRSDDGKDSLYLNTYISDMNVSYANALQTRAGDFVTDDLQSCIVYGYNYTDELNHSLCYVNGVEATKNQTTKLFNFSNTEPQYWEPDNTQFYCIANAPKTAGYTIATEPGEAPKLECDFSSVSVGNQSDIVIAKANSVANVEAVPLNFQHVLTAIEFQLDVDETVTSGFIHSVSINNIYTKGTLDLGYSSDLGFMASRAWTHKGDKSIFSINAGEDGLDLFGEKINLGTPIASLENNFAMMAIPQTLDGAELIISYSSTVNSTPINLRAKIQGTWSAGQRILYKLSLNDVLDAHFTNDSEICLDAHYVTSIDALGIHVGTNVKSWKLEIETHKADGNWLKLQTNGWNAATNLRDLQTREEGCYWVHQYFYGGDIYQYGDDGNVDASKTEKITNPIAVTTIQSNTYFGDGNRNIKFVLLAAENTSEHIRMAQVKLTVYPNNNYTGTPREIYFGDYNIEDNIEEKCLLKQMCPYYVDYSGGEIGAERIEEEPLEVPWGTHYVLTSASTDYDVVYGTPSIFQGGSIDIFIKLEAIIRAYISGTVTVDWGFLGFGGKFTFDMTDEVNASISNTQSENNGLQNTQNGFSTELVNTNAFIEWLKSKNAPTQSSTFEIHNHDANSAFMNALKKNAILAAKRTDTQQGTTNTIYYADLDRSREESMINWYLPAINEAASGVYQDNADGHACETSFYNNRVAKKYWTSTTVPATDNTKGKKAYVYTYGSSQTEENDQKCENYHVRAVRYNPEKAPTIATE